MKIMPFLAARRTYNQRPLMGVNVKFIDWEQQSTGAYYDGV
jgi:hypothetical protein